MYIAVDTYGATTAGLPIIQFCTLITAGRLCLLFSPKPQPTFSHSIVVFVSVVEQFSAHSPVLFVCLNRGVRHH